MWQFLYGGVGVTEKQMDEQVAKEEKAASEVEEITAEDIEIVEENTEEASEGNESNKQIKALTEEKDAIQERLLRLQAEYENYKRRTEKERIAERQYKAQDLATELLPVLDNFERALQTEVNEENKSFKDGIQMVYDQLTKALESQGVEPIDALHEQFDPNLHHAVMQTSEADVDKNVVVEELQKGYILKDKVIRPTMVKVNQ